MHLRVLFLLVLVVHAYQQEDWVAPSGFGQNSQRRLQSCSKCYHLNTCCSQSCDNGEYVENCKEDTSNCGTYNVINGANSCTSSGGGQKDCKLDSTNDVELIDKGVNEGTHSLSTDVYAITSKFDNTNLCPPQNCIVVYNSGDVQHQNCIVQDPATVGKFNFDTSLCSTGATKNSKWDIQCRVTWREGTFSAYKRVTSFVITNYYVVNCPLLYYGTSNTNMGDQIFQVGVGTTTVTKTIQQAVQSNYVASSTCKLNNCFIKERTNSGNTCLTTSSNLDPPPSWITMVQNNPDATTGTNLVFTVDISAVQAAKQICVFCYSTDVNPRLFYADSKVQFEVKLDCSTGAISASAAQTFNYNFKDVPTITTVGNFDSFFTINKAMCVKNGCTVKQSDCSSTYNTSPARITIDSNSPYAIYAAWNIAAGYAESASVVCEVKNPNNSNNKMSACQQITVIQSSANCNGNMTLQPPLQNPLESYNSTSPQNVKLGTDFFLLANPNYCPATSCKMYNPDCTTLYNGDKFTMQVGSPYQIQAVRNIPQGYTAQLCVKCTNNNYGQNFDTLTSNLFTYTQLPIDCNSKLSIVTTLPSNPNLNYDAVTTSQVVASLKNDFFTTSEPLCPITSCSLKASGCATAYTPGQQSIVANTVTIDLTSTKDVLAGYTETFCISCTNNNYGYNYQTITTSWTVTQKHHCTYSMTTGTTLPTDQTRTYSLSTATEVVVPDSRVTYTEAYATCTTHTCSLKDPDCTSAISTTKVTMGPGPTYAVSMARNFAAGYTKNFCIVCTNGYDSEAFKMAVIQLPIDCSGTLTPAPNPANPVLTYSTATPTQSLQPYTGFFSNSNPSECPVTSCTLYGTDCTTAYATAYPTGQLTIQVASPWLITANRNVVAGYIETVCVKCVNSGQTITYPQYRVEQQPSICANSLTISSSPPTNANIPYLATTPSSYALANMNFFFQNSQTGSCPITSCEIRAVGCTNTYASAYSPTRITIAATSPFAMTTVQNVNEGWTETVCIKCTNGQQIITHNNWIVKQNQNPCRESLSVQASPSPPNPKVLAYSQSPSTTSIGDQTTSHTFFANSLHASCPITSCSLMKPGCTLAYTGNKVQLASLAFSGTVNVFQGWTDTVCITCTNDGGGLTLQKIVLDNYVIQQTADPCASALNIKLPSPTNPLRYAYHVSNTQALGDWQTYIVNSAPAASNCDPTSCTLYGSGCTQSYAQAYPTGKVSMLANSPWTMTAVKNIVPGYTESLCISCTNGKDIQQIDEYVIVQEPNACWSALSAKNPPPTNPKIFDFAATGTESIAIWSDLITNTDTTSAGCDPTSCTMYGAGCTTTYSTAYPAGRITIGPGPNFALSSIKNENAGWTEIICVKCTNGIDTQAYDNLKIIQNPNVCKTALSLKTNPPPSNPIQFDYSFTVPPATGNVQGSAQFFISSVADGSCDITQCTLYAQGCTTPYATAYPSGKLSMLSTSPWTITAQLNVQIGWSQIICYSCTNNIGTITKDNYVVTQKPSICYTSLGPETTTPPTNPKLVAHSSTTSSSTINTWSDFFSNLDATNCPVTLCTLKAIGCVNSYASAYPIGKLSITSSTSLAAVVNIDQGWTETVCIICTNDNGIQYDTEYYDNYVVQQTPNPCLTALSIKNDPLPPNPKVFTFDATNSGSVGPWTTFINQATGTSASCAPTSCNILGAGCITTYNTAYPTGKLSINPASPFEITAVRNSHVDWVESICISCTNGLDTVKIDNYQVVQSENPCYTSLTAKSSPAPTNPKIFAYSASPTVGSVGTWSDFITNTAASGCVPTSCTILAKGCLNTYASAYPSGKLSMSDAVTIQASINNHNTWSEIVCIKCTNAAGGQNFDTEYLDNYVVQQTQNPCHTSLNPPATAPTNPMNFNFHATNTETVATGWSVFASNSDTTNCAVTSCTLYFKGCTIPYATKYPSGHVSISSTFPFAITATVNEHLGYVEELCVSCSNHIPFYTFDTQTYDNFNVSQNPNPCLTSLGPAATAPTNPFLFDYDASASIQVGNQATFTSNTQSVNCPVTSCALFAQGCSTPYASAFPSGRLTVGAAPNFAITAVRNVHDGWSETVCIKCSNHAFGQTFDTETLDNYVITQRENPCKTSLSGAATPPTNPSLTFHASLTGPAGTWSDFMQNSVTGCEPTSCTLYAQGCVQLYTIAFPQGHLSITGSPPVSITAQRHIHAGYVEVVCIKCTNSVPGATLATHSYDNYQVTQIKNPCYTSLSAQTLTNPNTYNFNLVGDQSIGNWNFFFANSVTGDCAPTSCALLGQGCSVTYATAYPTGRMSISPIFPFDVTAKRNIYAGYTETVCITCSNHNLGLTFQTITFDNFQIVQNPNPCTVSMTPAASPITSPVTLTYSLGATAPVAVWTDFFQNSQQGVCPVTACTLHSSDCSQAYSVVYPSGRLTIAAADPFEIRGDIGVNIGWSETVCISCTNGPLHDTETRANFVVTQTQNPCRIALSALAGAPTSHATMTYDHVTTSESIGDWSTFFTKAGAGCDVTSCIVMAAGCTAAYTGNKFTLTLTTPFAINAKKDVAGGYSETVCIKCTNDAGGLSLQTITHDNFVVSQTPMDFNTVCGATTPTTINPAPKRFVTGFIQLVPIISDSDRYFSLPQSTFETYFNYVTTPPGCKPYVYMLYQAVSPSLVEISDPQVKFYGTVNVNLEIRIDRTIAANDKVFFLRAVTYGGNFFADQEIHFTICPKTGGVTITPPSSHIHGSIGIGAPSATFPDDFYTMTPWTMTETFVGCGSISAAYQIVADAQALTIIKYPYTGDTGCTTLTSCLKIQGINTAAPTRVDFKMKVVPDFGQDTVIIDVTIWITNCVSQTISAYNAPDLILPRSPLLSSVLALPLYPSYTNRYTLSHMFQCPLISLSLFDNNNLALTHSKVVLQNGNSPQTSYLQIKTGVPFTQQTKLVGGIEGKTADQSLLIRVCGEETLSYANGKKEKVLALRVGQDDGLHRVDETQILANWVLAPVGDPCLINDFQLFYSINPTIAWRFEDNRYASMSGGLGFTALSVVTSSPTSTVKSAYIQVSTMGLVSSIFTYQILVCYQNALTTKEQSLYFSFARNSQTKGYNGKLLYSRQNLTTGFQINACSHCSNLSFKLYNSGGTTPLSGSTLQVTDSGELLVDTKNPFATDAVIEAYFDSSAYPECDAIIDKVKVPVRFEVCGTEKVTVRDLSTPVVFHSWKIYEPNYSVDLAPYKQNFTTNSVGCPIDSFELRAVLDRSLEETGETPWSRWVFIDSRSGRLIINHNNAYGIVNNTIYSVFFVGKSKGGNLGYMMFHFKVSLPPSNSAPFFAEQLKNLTLSIDAEEQRKGLKDPLYFAILPAIMDKENNQAILRIKEERVATCQCIQLKELNKRWVLEVDKTKVKNQDKGSYVYVVELIDSEYYTGGMNSNEYVFELVINYNVPTFNMVEQPWTVKEKVNPWEVVEKGIPPIIENYRQNEVPSQPQVFEFFNNFMTQYIYGRKFEDDSVSAPEVELKIANISEDGFITIVFNQDLILPPFTPYYKTIEKVEKAYSRWKEEGYATIDDWAFYNIMGYSKSKHNQTKVFNNDTKVTTDLYVEDTLDDGASQGSRRSLIPHETLNVSRDVMEFEFFKNSEIDERLLEYDLSIVEWEKDHMILYCNFTHPEAVSAGFLFDDVKIKVHNRFLFVSEKSGKMLQKEKDLLRDEFPRQTLPGINVKEYKEQARQIGTSLNVVFIVQFLVQFCLKGSLHRFWTLYYTIQVMVYLRIFDIKLPFNAETYTGEIQRMIEFYWLNVVTLVRLFSPNFTVSGLLLGSNQSERNMLDELTVYAIWVIVAILVIVVVYTVFKLCRQNQRKYGKLFRKTKNYILWNCIIRIFSVSYFQQCISAGHQIQIFIKLAFYGLQNTSQSSFEINFAIAMACLMLLIPLFTTYMLTVNRNELAEFYVKKRISNLYQDIHLYRSPFNIWYYPIFLLRRILFVVIPTFLIGQGFYQILILMILSSIYSMWYLRLQPHIDTGRVFIEIFNEAMVMALCYLLLIIQAFTFDLKRQYEFGWVYLAIIGFTVLVNLSQILIKMLSEMIARRIRKMRSKLRQKYLQEVQTLIEQHNLKEEAMMAQAEKKYKEELTKFMSQADPDYYLKKIKCKPQILKDVEANQQRRMIDKINEDLYQEFGTFGDLVHFARLDLVGNYQKVEMPKPVSIVKTKPELTLKQKMIQNLLSGDEKPMSNSLQNYLQMPEREAMRKRWNRFHKHQGVEYNNRVNFGLQRESDEEDKEDNDDIYQGKLDYLKLKNDQTLTNVRQEQEKISKQLSQPSILQEAMPASREKKKKKKQ